MTQPGAALPRDCAALGLRCLGAAMPSYQAPRAQWLNWANQKLVQKQPCIGWLQQVPGPDGNSVFYTFWCNKEGFLPAVFFQPIVQNSGTL